MDEMTTTEQENNNAESTDNDKSIFMFGMPRVEEDEPLESMKSSTTVEPLDTKKLDIQENDKDRKDRRYFSAFKLIVGCLIFLGLIYAIDVIDYGILKKSPSNLTKEIVEVIKTLLFTLSGYLFARKENGD